MTISRNISVMAQGASSSGILAGGYGGLGASISPTTAGNVLFTADGSVWSSTQKIVRTTVQNSTSGTTVPFTAIPSWVKRITMLLNEVSISGTDSFMVQIGSGSYVATGYVGYFGYLSGTNLVGSAVGTTTGFFVGAFAASTQTLSGTIILNNITGNIWSYTSTSVRNSGTAAQNGVTTSVYAPLSLSGALDRIQLTVSGTNTFDAGSVNILYE
jgi:hypothetical protein